MTATPERSGGAEGAWAKAVPNFNVAAVTGGFGKMWEKHYRIALSGTTVEPAEVVKVWRSNFGEFWPDGNRFFGTLELSPGDVAALSVGLPAGMKLSTGIMVLHAEETSFAFITPEGHMFNGMITFSAREAAGTTIVHIDALIRPQDPLTDLGMMFGGHRREDRFWMGTLERIATHFGVEAKATTRRVLIDRRRQWKHFGNIKQSVGIKALRGRA